MRKFTLVAVITALLAGGLVARAAHPIALGALIQPDVGVNPNYITSISSGFTIISNYTVLTGGNVPKIVSIGGSWTSGGSWNGLNTGGMDGIRAMGAIPLVTWQSDDNPNDKVNLYPDAQIAAGAYDTHITNYAMACKNWGHPFYLRFDHEMTGNWYPWCTDPSGPNHFTNSAADYVAAWKHVHDVFVGVAATNVLWVWCPGWNPATWAAAFPGDAYVDWVSLDEYNWGNSSMDHSWQTFTQVISTDYGRNDYTTLAALSAKPMMFTEFGCFEGGGDKGAWIKQSMLTDLPALCPRVEAVLWFQWNIGPDWRINTSTNSLTNFQAVAASPLYGGTITADGRGLVDTSQTGTILMDFGDPAAANQTQVAGWNNITNGGGFTVSNTVSVSGRTLSLIDSSGNPSGITMTVVVPFSAQNGNGITAGGPAAYPSTAYRDSLYGNTESFATGNGTVANIFPVLNFSGFNPSQTYTFKFYASRNSGDHRTTRYTLAGASTNFTDLDPGTNTTFVATLAHFAADTNGVIQYQQTPELTTIPPYAPNTQANHFTYLGIMEIDFDPTNSVQVSSSANPSFLGSNVTFTATVQTNAVAAGDATGSVVFKANGVVFGTSLVNGGIAAITNNTLPVGTNFITAEYGGDSQYRGSTNSLAGGQIVTAYHQDILIDFGPNDGSNGNITTNPDYLGHYWNNLISTASGSGLNNLITVNNGVTPAGLIISSGFNAAGKLSNGLLTPEYALLGNFAVTNATEDYFYTAGSASVTLTNLDSTRVYNLRLFGTRYTDAATTRITQYTVTGGNGSFTTNLQTSGNNNWTNNGVVYYGNNSIVASVNGVTPNGSNQIQVGVGIVTGPFGYLGIMEVTANRPPVANSKSYSRNGSTAWKIALSDLLTNASDADGDLLALVRTSTSTNGITAVISGGYVLYTNTSLVDDQFTYTVTDGLGGTGTAVITLTAGNTSGVGGQIGSFARNGGTMSMTFTGLPGYKYNVQVATNLTGNWSTLWTTNAPGNGIFQFDDKAVPAPNAYYRLMWNGN